MRLWDVWPARVTIWLTRSVVAVSAAALLLVGVASPAGADVSVTPAEAVQGDAGELRFHVTNDNATASIATIEMIMPVDSPIAEVYPLSVDDWAPSIVMRDLDTPLQGIHRGGVTETTASVTWTAVPGKELPPGATAVLALALGPLPAVPRLAVDIVVGTSDGAVVRYPSPVVVLKPAPVDPAALAAAAADDAAGTGPSYPLWTIGILVAVAVLVVFGVWDQRRRRDVNISATVETADKTPELVRAGRGVT